MLVEYRSPECVDRRDSRAGNDGCAHSGADDGRFRARDQTSGAECDDVRVLVRLRRLGCAATGCMSRRPRRMAGRLPLVLNLAGATQNGLLQEAQSGMDSSSDKHGYLVAYPDGTRISTVLSPDPVAKDAQYGFNAGACCGLPSTNHVDDVDFLLATICECRRAHTGRSPSRLRDRVCRTAG